MILVWPLVAADNSKTAEKAFREGLRLAQANLNARALDAFSEAIRLRGDYADAYEQRARLRRLAGDDAGATEDLKATVRLEPANAEAWRLLGEAHRRVGHN